MIYAFLLLSLILGDLVNFKSIDKSRTHFLLYTKSLIIEEAFIKAAKISSIQSSYLFCSEIVLCDFNESSKAYLFRNEQMLEYT